MLTFYFSSGKNFDSITHLYVNVELLCMCNDRCVCIYVFNSACTDLFQMQLNLDVSLLVDQVVDYSCATNERGQYCAIAQLDDVTDVCIMLMKQSRSLDEDEYIYICCLFSPSVVYNCCPLLVGPE